MALTEYGVDDREWVLPQEEDREGAEEGHSRREGRAKSQGLRGTFEGREKLIADVRKEEQNCMTDKQALRPCSLEESRRIRLRGSCPAVLF